MNLITKFTSPTKFDYYSKGTIWQNKVDDHETILYVQAGTEEIPNWVKISNYLENSIKEYLNGNISRENLNQLFNDLLI